MTLVLGASISGRFVIMTSDTRRVLVKKTNYDFETGKITWETDPVAVEDAKDIKTHRLNNMVLVGAGGDTDLSTHIVGLLKKEVGEDYDLADCKQVLAAIIEAIRMAIDNDRGPEFLKVLNIIDGVTVLMMGFYRDGTTGIVGFHSGTGKPKVTEVRAKEGEYLDHSIAPAKEYARRSAEMLSYSSMFDEEALKILPPEQVGSTVFNTVLNNLSMIHWAVSYHHPVEVSPDFEIHAISYNPKDEKESFKYSRAPHDHSLSHRFHRELEKHL